MCEQRHIDDLPSVIIRIVNCITGNMGHQTHYEQHKIITSWTQSLQLTHTAAQPGKHLAVTISTLIWKFNAHIHQTKQVNLQRILNYVQLRTIKDFLDR